MKSDNGNADQKLREATFENLLQGLVWCESLFWTEHERMDADAWRALLLTKEAVVAELERRFNVNDDGLRAMCTLYQNWQKEMKR